MTAVEKLGIAFIQWEKDRYDFVKTGKDKPVSYDKFIKPFLEMEKQQIIDAFTVGNRNEKYQFETSQQYYNEKFNK
jgi:hypothetical protein